MPTICATDGPFSRSSSEFRGAVARRAVKVAATLGLDKIKAFRKFIHVYGPSVRLRRPGCAGLSAIWASKIFNPTLDYDHPSNMSAQRGTASLPLGRALINAMS